MFTVSWCGKAKWSATTPDNCNEEIYKSVQSRCSPAFICFQSECRFSSFKQIDFSNSHRLINQKRNPAATDVTDVFFLFTTQMLQRHSSKHDDLHVTNHFYKHFFFFFLSPKFYAGVFPQQQSQHVFQGLLNSSFFHSERCSRFLWLTTSSCTLENKQVVFTHLTTPGHPGCTS